MTGGNSLEDGVDEVGSGFMAGLAFEDRVRIAKPRKVGSARPRVEIDQQTVIARVSPRRSDPAPGIIEIAEHDGLSRAGSLTRGDDLAIAQRPIVLFRGDLRRVDTLDAVGALFHDAAAAYRHVRVPQS